MAALDSSILSLEQVNAVQQKINVAVADLTAARRAITRRTVEWQSVTQASSLAQEAPQQLMH